MLCGIFTDGCDPLVLLYAGEMEGALSGKFMLEGFSSHRFAYGRYVDAWLRSDNHVHAM